MLKDVIFLDRWQFEPDDEVDDEPATALQVTPVVRPVSATAVATGTHLHLPCGAHSLAELCAGVTAHRDAMRQRSSTPQLKGTKPPKMDRCPSAPPGGAVFGTGSKGCTSPESPKAALP